MVSSVRDRFQTLFVIANRNNLSLLRELAKPSRLDRNASLIGEQCRRRSSLRRACSCSRRKPDRGSSASSRECSVPSGRMLARTRALRHSRRNCTAAKRAEEQVENLRRDILRSVPRGAIARLSMMVEGTLPERYWLARRVSPVGPSFAACRSSLR